MALTTFKEGDIIRDVGARFDAIFFVAKGRIEADFSGRKFVYGQGDTVGVCGVSRGIYGMSYRAADEVTLFAYPCENFADVGGFLRGNADLMSKVVSSMYVQTSNLIEYRAELIEEAKKAYSVLKAAFPEYERLCGLYSFAAKRLHGFDALTQPGENDLIEDWLPSYYPEFVGLESAVKKEIFSNAHISMGFLHIGVEHISKIMQSVRLYREYLDNISKMYLDESEHDILALIAELHVGSVNIKGADEAISMISAPVKEMLKELTSLEQSLLIKRLALKEEDLVQRREAMGEIIEALDEDGVKQNLKDALYTILEYSGLKEEERNKFARGVYEFTQFRDRTSSEDEVFRLRRELTKTFYEIYTAIFIKTLKEPKVPTIIKMFLNFGFVDVALAGAENADYLFSIADSFKGNPQQGIYTIVEWLTAIYNGEKEPSQGDLDTDYATYVKESVQARRLMPDVADKEERRLLVDKMGKLRFELEAVFPIGNKITFGRITSYCPLFGDHNVQRHLHRCLVTADILKERMDEILSLDFSAFYRDVVYSNPDIGINSMQLGKEHMPNIILMPNVGTRGVMWQEIEGRNRQTSARMFLPTFYLEDLRPAFMRLVGEFRWEMCKRVQGARWSDLSSPSLTSEYFNYLQFYRNNRELSLEAKSSVKTELVRARNVYRAVFVRNYIDWLTYEAGGSQRLNKVARKIMFQYCPFPQELREKLASNPQYAEALRQFDMKNRQAQQKLANQMQRISQLGKIVPDELIEEMHLLQR
ncbi:MAG: hypothetical protein LBE35_09045 [Clostridiales bacterium]|jgi:PAS domain-containing protein|nr:hypothetical protein [Clostridiales bacterium]